MADVEAPEDQIARLRLIRSDNIGPVTYCQLLARFGTAEAAIEALPMLARRGGGRAPPELLVQVNTGDEPQKSGVPRAEAESFLRACREEHGLAVRGLMCIPPVEADPVPHFAWLAGLAARHGLPVLSMGMSADFEAAVACGATHVRVGSAIFGARG